jgi:phospholipase/carboxylesterase
MTELLDNIEIETAPNPGAAVIWMHGLGADGNDFVPLVRELDLSGLPGIRFVFPHANAIPVTVNNGYVMRAWYDIVGADLTRREDEAGLRASQAQIEALIEREKARGIPAARIILAGFSQGCAMALQTGLRHPEKLAGLMCLSGYVPLAASVAHERSEASIDTPIFMVHGRQDGVIPLARAEQSRDLLKAIGYDVSGTTIRCSTRCAGRGRPYAPGSGKCWPSLLRPAPLKRRSRARGNGVFLTLRTECRNARYGVELPPLLHHQKAAHEKDRHGKERRQEIDGQDDRPGRCRFRQQRQRRARSARAAQARPGGRAGAVRRQAQRRPGAAAPGQGKGDRRRTQRAGRRPAGQGPRGLTTIYGEQHGKERRTRRRDAGADSLVHRS